MKNIAKACFVWVALSSSSVGAADLVSVTASDPVASSEPGWTYSVTSYFWAAGLSGQTSQLGLPVIDIDADFSSILDNLDFAAMAIEVWTTASDIEAQSRFNLLPVERRRQKPAARLTLAKQLAPDRDREDIPQRRNLLA